MTSDKTVCFRRVIDTKNRTMGTVRQQYCYGPIKRFPREFDLMRTSPLSIIKTDDEDKLRLNTKLWSVRLLAKVPWTIGPRSHWLWTIRSPLLQLPTIDGIRPLMLNLGAVVKHVVYSRRFGASLIAPVSG